VTYHRGGCQERNALEDGIELHACGCDGAFRAEEVNLRAARVVQRLVEGARGCKLQDSRG
jgi:hypothetical protein